MDRNKPVLVVALVFVALLGGLTLQVLLEKGSPDILTVTSLIILVMFGLAIWGALREPPESS
jgi:drug/metabolite transporter (DMT)-like permease